MKGILTFIYFFVYAASYSQGIERISVKGADLTAFYDKQEYKYPKFLTAHVYLNDGDSAIGRFNFDFFDQTLRYLNERGETEILSNAKDVNFATVGTDTFFYNNGFLEWVASSATERLAVKHIFKLISRQNIGAYGMSSPTMSVKSIGRVSGAGAPIDLPPDEELVFTKETTYYISHIKNRATDFKVANKETFVKFYPKKNMEDYLSDNKMNLTKEEDLIDAFIYANTPAAKK